MVPYDGVGPPLSAVFGRVRYIEIRVDGRALGVIHVSWHQAEHYDCQVMYVVPPQVYLRTVSELYQRLRRVLAHTSHAMAQCTSVRNSSYLITSRHASSHAMSSACAC